MKKIFSRKLQRKQERLEKKQKKNLFFQKKKDGKTKTDNNDNNKSPAGKFCFGFSSFDVDNLLF
mgnify:CR=1 FL=1